MLDTMEVSNVKIAVLSGKGGTGKTLVATNLAAVAEKAVYIDCDVEEPNGHLFFKPESIKIEKVSVKIPYVNQEACNGCRLCVDFCKFNSLVYIKNKLKIFEDVCHSCGGCILFCPEKALSEKDKIIGEIIDGISENVRVITGVLNTGEESGVPIIKKLMSIGMKGLTIIDSPPGSACTVMESIKNVDYCILVTEPTTFGVHNLNMVYQLVKLFNKPFGVIINKVYGEDNPAKVFCQENNIRIIGEIPFDEELSRMNSNGLILSREKEEYYALFSNLLESVLKEVSHEETINT